MRLDRLTNKFQLALADAQSLALGHDNQFIEPLHLMSALLNQEGGSVSPLLTSAGINAGQLRTDINQALNRLPQVEGTGGDVQPSQDLVRVLNLCDKLAQKRGDNFISSELFVLAALESRGTLADILKAAGATTGRITSSCIVILQWDIAIDKFHHRPAQSNKQQRRQDAGHLKPARKAGKTGGNAR